MNQIITKQEEQNISVYKNIRITQIDNIEIIQQTGDQPDFHEEYETISKKRIQDYVQYVTVFKHLMQPIDMKQQLEQNELFQQKQKVQINNYQKHYSKFSKIQDLNLPQNFWTNEVKFPKKQNALPFIFKNKRKENIKQNTFNQDELSTEDYSLNQQQTSLNSSQNQEINKTNKKPKTNNFPNKNKLFINEILRFFDNQHNLDQIQFPSEKLKNDIHNFFKKVRSSGKKISEQGKVLKSDLYYHSHFIIMFLFMNTENIDHLINNQKDQEIYEKVVGQKLQQQDIFSENLQYLNFIKYCCYHLLKENLITKYQQEAKQQNFEKNYELRAYYGIQQMFQGKLLQRF